MGCYLSKIPIPADQPSDKATSGAFQEDGESCGQDSQQTVAQRQAGTATKVAAAPSQAAAAAASSSAASAAATHHLAANMSVADGVRQAATSSSPPQDQLFNGSADALPLNHTRPGPTSKLVKVSSLKAEALAKVYSPEAGEQTPAEHKASSGHAEAPTAQDPPAHSAAEPTSVELEYRASSLPDNDEDRLHTLRTIRPLDAKLDQRYDDMVKLVSSIFKVPITQLSIVDRDWVHLVAVTGMPNIDLPRETSFCTWTMLPVKPEVLVIEDTIRDARFADLPQCKCEPFIRFYAGTPLVASNGHRLGNLCVVDVVPRQMDAAGCSTLIHLAEMIVRSLEKDILLRKKSESQRKLNVNVVAPSLLRSQDLLEEKVALCDASDPDWPIVFVTDPWSQATGVPVGEALGRSLWKVFKPPADSVQLDKQIAQQADTGRISPLEFSSQGPASSGGTKSCRLSIRLAGSQMTGAPLVGVPAFVDSAGRADPHRLCFVHLDAPSSVQSVDSEMTVQSSSNSSVSAASGASSLMSRKSSQLLPSAEDIFETVRLGSLVGQGSYGRVVRGMWHGILVAVKVMETQLPATLDGEKGPQEIKVILEATLCTELRHPNIVQTFKHATRRGVRSGGSTRWLLEPRPDSAGTGSPTTRSTPPTPKSAPAPAMRPESASPMGRGAGPNVLETWMLLEYCSKGSLANAIDRGWFRTERSLVSGDPSMPAILATAAEIASALAYLHSHNVLHGDLTPCNILLTTSGSDFRGFTVKVADFGLSRIAEKSVMNTGTYGTPTHMPPELLMEGSLTQQADVYAFGVLLWEMYTGQRPWNRMRAHQIIFAVTIQNRSLTFPEQTPEGYKDLATACMARDYANRPSFNEVLQAIRNLQMAEPVPIGNSMAQ